MNKSQSKRIAAQTKTNSHCCICERQEAKICKLMCDKPVCSVCYLIWSDSTDPHVGKIREASLGDEGREIERSIAANEGNES